MRPLLIAIGILMSGWAVAQTNTFPQSGNVGIGTTSPTFPLTVQGTIQGRGMAAFTQSTPVNTLVVDASSSLFHKIYNNASNVDLSIGTNYSTIQLYLKSDGKVGIGTSTPDQLLTLKGGGIGFDGISNDKKLYSPTDGLLEWMTHTSAALPGFAVSHQGNKKIYLAASGNSYFAGGNVGIGTTSPHNFYQLQVVNATGENALMGISNQGTNTGDRQLRMGFSSGATVATIQATRLNIADDINLSLQPGGGNVGIGTLDTKGYKLAVNGDAIFIKVKVKQYATWPDYVFHTAFKLPSLSEVEAFIKTHQHLPDVPSAEEVEKNGLDVGENQAVLLKKIEELTLYVIEMKKEIDALKQSTKQ